MTLVELPATLNCQTTGTAFNLFPVALHSSWAPCTLSFDAQMSTPAVALHAERHHAGLERTTCLAHTHCMAYGVGADGGSCSCSGQQGRLTTAADAHAAALQGCTGGPALRASSLLLIHHGCVIPRTPTLLNPCDSHLPNLRIEFGVPVLG